MNNASERSDRLRLLEVELRKRKLDAFFVTNEVNVSYLTGFKGHDSMLLLTPGKRYFITDSRYIEEAEEQLEGFRVEMGEKSTYETVASLVSRHRLKDIGFESMNLPYGVAMKLGAMIGNAKMIALSGVVEAIRSVKSHSEIRAIKRAIELIKRVLNETLVSIRPGLKESYLARKIEIGLIESGAKAGFEPIVASGANSSRPHARPTDDKIAKNDSVMFDVGASLEGYNSDITRMVPVGNAGNRLLTIYKIVREAQDRAIAMIKPGIKLSEIDKAARSYIIREGYGKYFGHALGHGVGMEVHEAPAVSGSNQEMVRPGMVFTVEPAVYIPKLGGVRIEDMVLVTENGCEVLSR